MLLTDNEIKDKLELPSAISAGDPVDTTHKAVYAWLRRKTRRNFEQQTYTTEFDIEPGQDFLLLKDWPVDSSTGVIVEQIQRASDGSVEAVYTYQANEYVVDYENGIVELLSGSFPAGKRTVQARNYKAGYASDDVLNGVGDVPIAKELMLSLIDQYRHHFAKHNFQFQSHSAGEVSTTYNFTLTDWQKRLLASLEKEDG